MKKKMGAMELSFGMIFSIILIVVFIAFAVYAIQKFLGISDTARINSFKDALQSDVDKMWRGSQGSQEKEYNLPSKIKKICFAYYSSESKGPNSNMYEELRRGYYENENLFFYPINSADGLTFKVEHIDIGKITEDENPLCFDNEVKLIIKKNFEDALVIIEKT